MTDPTDAQIDAMLRRINQYAAIALAGHPHRARAVEILAAGGWLFTRPAGNGRFEFVVGWFDDPGMRPVDADPDEIISLMTVPRAALLSGPSDD